MQTFTLHSGHTVTTQRSGHTVEFVTSTPDGGVISTVRHPFAEAVPLLRSLACRTRD